MLLVLGYYKFKCLYIPPSFLAFHIKNIRNIHIVSTNQIADTSHFNGKSISKNVIKNNSCFS